MELPGVVRVALWLVMLSGVACQDASVCQVPQTTSDSVCSSVKVLLGGVSEVHQRVLQEMCKRGQQHVLLKAREPPKDSSPFMEPVRRAEQFAVVILHRDNFSDRINWTSGDAENVICNSKWYVDEEMALLNHYSWYRHGLPLWPLLNQALAPKPRLFSRKKKLDWPNYAIATPLYLVFREISNFRDPRIAIQKLFAGDLAGQQSELDRQSSFVQSDKFQKDVIDLYEAKESDITNDVAGYNNWLMPLITRSLPPMIESFKARQKRRGSKQSDISTCPDELYVYFLQKPCASSASCLLLNELMLILRTVDCSAVTDLVVGFSVG